MSGTHGQALLPRPVLTPIALTPRLGAIAGEAALLARVTGASALVFVHVGEESARPELESRLGEAGHSGARLEIRSGQPARVIVDMAREIDADLVVAGALEREGLLQYFVGSVARRVAREAHCSVLLLTAPRLKPAAFFARWVVAAAENERSDDLFAFVGKLARVAPPESIEVVSEYAAPRLRASVHGVDPYEIEAVEQRALAAERERLAERIVAAELLLPGRLKTSCLRGRIGWESAQVARHTGADLLFSAAPERSSIWNKLVQSGVEFALESLPCALWLHRPVAAERTAS